MSAESNSRRRVRSDVQQSIKVFDVLNEVEVGRLVNIHEEGFMVLGGDVVRENRLYQLVFMLSETIEGKREIHVGAECLWVREAVGGDQNWAGFHIMDVAEDDLSTIRAISC